MAEAGRPEGRVGGRWVARATWAYAAVVLATLAMIRWRGEEWWPATVLMFLPRWPFLVPIAPLALLAAWRGPRGIWGTLGAIALVAAGPLMAGSLPIGRIASPPGPGPRFRIMAFNMGQAPIDAAKFARLLEREEIDLVCLQEVQHGPAMDSIFARGWFRDERGMIASRLPIVAEWDSVNRWDGTYHLWNRQVARVRVRAPDGAEFVVSSVHLPTIREGFTELRRRHLDGLRLHLNWRREQAEAMAIELAEVADWPELVGGDLNTPADSPLLGPLRSRFIFAFERAGWGYGYTRPTSLPWTRIDHILASPQWSVSRCWVGPDLGSDHLPLLAEVVLGSK